MKGKRVREVKRVEGNVPGDVSEENAVPPHRIPEWHFWAQITAERQFGVDWRKKVAELPYISWDEDGRERDG